MKITSNYLLTVIRFSIEYYFKFLNSTKNVSHKILEPRVLSSSSSMIDNDEDRGRDEKGKVKENWCLKTFDTTLHR